MTALLSAGVKAYYSTSAAQGGGFSSLSDKKQIKGVTALTIPSGQNEEVESTTIETGIDDGRSYIQGFREDVSINITIQWDDNEASHVALRTAQAAQTAQRFYLEVPSSHETNVLGIDIKGARVRNLTINEAINSIQTATFDILMRAAPTISNAPVAPISED